MGSENCAKATADAFELLVQEECDEVAKPEWWHDEGLKTLSARAVRAAPNHLAAYCMRAAVLSGLFYAAWELGPRSAVELWEAATYFERAAALCAPVGKAGLARDADECRSLAEAM